MTVEASIWLELLTAEERAALNPEPRELPLARPDILVVGGGMVGVATALACQEAGLGSVLLIEAGHLGAGATGGAAGLLSPEAHLGVDPKAFVDLGRASLVRWRALDSAMTDGVGLVDRNLLLLAPHPDGFVAHPPAGAQWLDADEVAQLVPGLAAGSPGVLIRDQARVNPIRALARLAARLEHVATGVAATAVTIDGRRITGVTTTAGTISPGTVAFATGSPPALDGLDIGVPADLVKGHLLVTRPASLDLPVAVDPIAAQLEDGRLLVGGSLDIGDSTPLVRPDVIEGILAYLAIILPSLDGVGLTHQWCCFRPHHPDGLPVIDRIRGVENAWFTSGHFRTGILMAPATGAALAQWIRTGERPDLVAAFSIDRLP
jgi:glycine oxidase